MKTALITGATSGIGKATAELFAKQGIQLVLCGRRAGRLTTLQSTLGQQVPVHCLTFDVRDRTATLQAIASIPETFQSIDILINNAGNAHGLDPIQRGSFDDWDAMLDINVKGLLYVSQPIIQRMIEKGSGHIVNIGSIAGKEAYPNGNVYCASKHAVDALSQAMRIDLNGTGVKVSQVCPGMVETEFSEVRFKGDTQRADSVYKGYDPLTAEDIADLIYFMVSRPKHVNIADVLILPEAQANATTLSKTTP
ncbi:MAG: SDR family NAD(P)-dependent oxidoreductase [Saprospiraceae bacterium]|nr:SDR family NAD(P)-dependent oxidoreductase [Saprospiraceae bacterium]